MGYRYFSTAKRGVSFPFGFGLSYTEFSYSKPKISKSGDKYVIATTIKNTGNVAGSEVVQLYVKAPVDASIAVKPESELKAFAKTKLLAPGESETVRLSFSERDIASFDEAASAWSTAKGTYIVQLRKSADPKIKHLRFFVQNQQKKAMDCGKYSGSGRTRKRYEMRLCPGIS